MDSFQNLLKSNPLLHSWFTINLVTYDKSNSYRLLAHHSKLKIRTCSELLVCNCGSIQLLLLLVFFLAPVKFYGSVEPPTKARKLVKVHRGWETAEARRLQVKAPMKNRKMVTQAKLFAKFRCGSPMLASLQVHTSLRSVSYRAR